MEGQGYPGMVQWGAGELAMCMRQSAKVQELDGVGYNSACKVAVK